jgi:hypothetical protein
MPFSPGGEPRPAPVGAGLFYANNEIKKNHQLYNWWEAAVLL